MSNTFGKDQAKTKDTSADLFTPEIDHQQFTYTIDDLVDLSELQKLFELQNVFSELPVGLIDLENNILVNVGWVDTCQQFQRTNVSSAQSCCDSDFYTKDHVGKGKSKIYQCKHGLYNIVIPVVVTGKHLANLFLGQFVYVDEEAISFLTQQDSHDGYDQKTFQEILKKVPRITRVQAQKLMDYHAKLIEIITQQAYQKLRWLQDNKERYDLATAAANVGVWDWDVPHNKVYYSDIWKAQIGYKPTEIKNDFQTWIDHLHPDDKERCLVAVDQYIREPKGKFVLNFRFRHKKGHYVYIHNEAESQVDEDGKVLRLFGAHIDTTKQKLSEIEVRESEQKYKTLTESSKDQIYIVSRDFHIEFVNGEAAKAFHLPASQIIGRHMEELFSPQVATKQIAELKSVLEEGKTRSTVSASNFQGSNVWFDTTLVPLFNEKGDVISVMGVARNVTESKQKEKAITDSEERFRSLTKATAQLVWSTNANGEIIDFQEDWSAYTGQSFEQMKGHGYLSVIHPDDLEKTGQAWSEALEQKLPYVFEHRLRRKDGAFRYAEVRGVPIIDPHGNIKEWIGIYADIHDKKLAMDLVLESEKRLSRAIEDSPFPVMIHVEGGEVLQISRSWTELSGYTFEDVGTIDHWLSRACGMNSSEVMEYLQNVYASEVKTRHSKFKISCKDGNLAIWEFSTSPIGTLSDGRKIVISMANDITSREKATEQLERSEANMKVILDSMPFGACIIGEDKVIKSVNLAALQMMGYANASDVVGKRCHDTLCPAEEGKCPILDFHQGIEQSDRILVTKDKKRIPILKSVIPIVLGDERVLLETFVDISEKKALEERLEADRDKLLAVLDGIADVIYVADPETYELVHVNEIFRKNWGNKVLGRKCYEVLQSRTSPCSFCTNDQIFGENFGKTYVWEFQNEVNKKWYRCSDKAITWHDGRKLRFELATDITELKNIEAEKTDANWQLSERIKEISCLYQINELLRANNTDVSKVLRGIVTKIPDGWLNPEITAAKIVFDNIEMHSDNYAESELFIEEKITIDDIQRGIMRVVILQNENQSQDRRFIKEEKKLLKEIVFNFERYYNELKYASALSESEQQFKSLINNSPIPMVITDIASNIEYTNLSFESVIGYSLEEIPHVDQWWLLAYPNEEYREKMKAMWEAAMSEALEQKRASEPVEAVVTCKNGEKRVFSVIGTEIGTKVLVLLIDLTDRIKAEEERDRFFDVSLDLLCIAGTDGYFKRINPAWMLLLGYSEKELLSKPFLDFVHPDDLATTLAEVEKLSKGKPTVSFMNRYRCANGDYKYLSWKTTPFGDTLYAAASDITDLKLSEQKLIEVANDLKRSNQELEQFAYVASHDLQEPLRMVSSFTQLLEKRYKDKIDENANTYIRYAVDGANRMQVLINDLLDFSRISTRGKAFVKFDANAELHAVLRGMRLAIDEKNAQITSDKLPEIKADKSQFQRLLQNLIGNAIKFHKPSENPVVHVSAKNFKDYWQFSVKDNGIGIKAEYKDRIFVIFQRLHSKTAYKGTGIGLAVCKRIVERHGGSIWFESEQDKGTTFIFTLKKQKNKA